MARNLIPVGVTIRSVKPGDTRKRLSDGEGLYLRLFVKGDAHGWRLNYTVNGVRKNLSLGSYPATGLRWPATRPTRPVRWWRPASTPATPASPTGS